MSKRKSGRGSGKSAMKGVASAGIAGVTHQLQDALNRADTLIGALAATATGTVETLQKQSSLAIEGLRSTLDGISEGSLDGVQDTAKAAIRYVRKHPWQSAAVAVGVGVTALVLREGSRQLH